MWAQLSGTKIKLETFEANESLGRSDVRHYAPPKRPRFYHFNAQGNGFLTNNEFRLPDKSLFLIRIGL